MSVQNVNQSPFDMIKPLELNNQPKPVVEVKENVEGKKFSLKDLSIVDKFEKNIKNQCDMQDTVTVPRTIFKGYLGFMAGTTLTGLGALAKKGGKLNRTLSTAGALSCLYGTWSFVRPYVIKDSQKKD